MNYKITAIQLFDYVEHRQINDDGDYENFYSYSANIALDDKVMVEVSGDFDTCSFSVPSSSETYWNDQALQDDFSEKVDWDELQNYMEEQLGFENNIGWLEDNATEIMLPENAKYRYGKGE